MQPGSLAFADGKPVLGACDGSACRNEPPGLLTAGAGIGLAGAGNIAFADQEKAKEVGAVEDLMREHGVLRRCLIVYSEEAARLRGGGHVDPQPIQDTADLFLRFGEGYHEMQLGRQSYRQFSRFGAAQDTVDAARGNAKKLNHVDTIGYQQPARRRET